MQLPIPHDWDGENWTCIQVQWPDSPLWIAMLAGFLSQPARGRFWDADTGSIKDTQEIGWEIFDRNIPFVDCAGETVIIETPAGIGGGSMMCMEEMIMSLCGYNPKAFEIRDGSLWIRDFCGDWVEIGELASTAEEPPEDPAGDVDPPGGYKACGKVDHLVDQFIALSDAIWDNYDNLITYEWQVRNAVSGAVNLSRPRLYQWLAQMVLLEPLFSKENFNNADSVQKAKCLAVASVLPTSVGTDLETEAVVNALTTSFEGDFGPMSAWHWYAYWDFVRHTFGAKDCRLLLSLGSTNENADCSCPQIPGTGDELIVWFSGDLVADNDGVQGAFMQNSDIDLQGRRQRSHVWFQNGTNRSLRDGRISLAGDKASVVSMTIRQYPDLTTNYLSYPLKEWRTAAPPNPTADWHDLDVQGPSAKTVVRDDNAGYVDHIFTDIVGGVDHVYIGDGRCYSPNPDVSAIWYWEIIEVNGATVVPVGPE